MGSVCYFEDNQSICRICFEIKSDVRPLFSKKEDRFIYEELVKYANLNLHINDGGPATICGQCFEELNVFMTFLDKCKRSNQLFLQFMQCQNDTRHIDRVQILPQDASHSDRSSILPHSKKQIDSATNLPHAIHTGSSSSLPLGVHHIDSSSNLPHGADGRDTEDGSNENENENCAQDNLTHNLNNPMLRVAPSKPSHKCQICSKVFTRKFNYKQHLERHGGERQWQCGRCGAACATGARARRCCAAGARKACPAPGCGKSFTSATNLHTHIRKHSGERPFSCGDCGKTFGSKNTLRDHMKTHTGVKPYMCPTCGKQFATNKLSAHMRTHGARTHACGSCARRFPDARALRLHARTHAPPTRAHACAACPARYNHKQSLNKHLRKRHGVKTS